MLGPLFWKLEKQHVVQRRYDSDATLCLVILYGGFGFTASVLSMPASYATRQDPFFLTRPVSWTY